MIPEYAHLRKELSEATFRPHQPRLLFIFTVQTLAFALIYSLVVWSIPWYFKALMSITIGYCWAVSGLLAHELLHGSIIRSKFWQDILGFFCFLPYLISPTFWRYWHNRLHHSFTQKSILDPDAYPTLTIFKQSKFIQWMFPFSPGSGHKRSYFYFFFWFSFNAQIAQHYLRYRNGTFKSLDHSRVNKELALAIIIHIAALTLIGPTHWVWAVLIPFFVMNYIPFSYISTNHNLSPLTKKNDPLVNSLTVTNNPILEYLHVNFGYHVEHHLFPTMNGIHAKKVHKLLQENYADKYQIMPKWKALVALYKTPRIYKNDRELVHPYTGKTHPTLEPLGLKKNTEANTSTVSQPRPLPKQNHAHH